MLFDGMKVFSATLPDARTRLGEVVTDWIATNRVLKLIDLVVRQSSDASFHCLTIVVFYRH
jgi:hypothetical protein